MKKENINKTIAKNTLFLYFRMFLTMGVGLYTSRLVLDALGVVDYGVYGLVGGIVTTFAFLNSAMASATQRYLSFDIGKNDIERLKKTFNATLNIHILIAFIILILAETIGLWFVNYQLNIPSDRMVAANWVYQFSVFAFILNVIQVPYNALLFAREHMSVYAYVSILETILKLIIVLILVQVNTDKLILYAILTFIVAFVIRMIYKLYCKKHFKESVYKFYWDKAYYKELMSYSGWNLFGNIAAVARGQGSNILLNLFFGPIANASYSLTVMVQGVVGSFVSNFQVAVNPQIIKNYAKGDKDASINLIYKSAKFSYFGMLILVVPLLINLDYVMNLWLKEVPAYAIEFIRLALVCSMIETLSNPLMSGLQATGKIKLYQVIVGTLVFLNFPLIWLLFKYTNLPISLYWSYLLIAIISLLFRLYFIQNLMKVNINQFFSKVLLRISLVSLSIVVLYYLGGNYLIESEKFLLFIVKTIITVLIIVLITSMIGLTKGERRFIMHIVQSKMKAKL
ncbi:oligosaccharide flippase family protein [uncultured Tenacibaculum sp.]|uniref:oligosaccharide flippase family protein n=1 Tax=uncultured Tenacibaculum sp. TaxID=174713 RepID=UPI002631E09B|nr:oligosaccharide flippase family protein [uncultured Tenacibaculum sp.]